MVSFHTSSGICVNKRLEIEKISDIEDAEQAVEKAADQIDVLSKYRIE